MAFKVSFPLTDTSFITKSLSFAITILNTFGKERVSIKELDTTLE